MWSSLTLRPAGKLSARPITLFFLAIIMALFGIIALSTTSAQAQAANPDGMAVWSGENLDYGGIILTKSNSPDTDENVPNLSGTKCQDNPNVYYSAVSTRNNDGNYWLDVICLNSGSDGSDKTKIIPAMLLEYTVPKDKYNPDTDKPGKFNNQRPKEIKIAKLGTDAVGNPIDTNGTGENQATSCDSTYTHGIGWIVCPITNFLASGMDWLFTVLTNFLVVQPTSTNQTNVLYRAWSIMRNLANVLFVVGFLIIIYSQITSLGLSNYGIKRLLPRLVIAAIIVNVSYWICAAAIDLSNISGFALQQMFISIRNSLELPGVTDGSWQVVKWGDVASYVLSGGALLGIGGLAALGVTVGVAGAGAAIMLLLPILLGVLLSALVAILMLAARQALITILVIVSPLACVAYLLPNTEKYFERWRELFGTMLLVFPIFAVVFGGSQLAGTAILLNAHKGDANQITIILLGMAVQIAPLAITPLLIKISGNILGRFAGIVNNPNRGLIDRSRTFTKDNYAHSKARRTGEGYVDEEGRFRFTRNNPGTQLARALDKRKRTRAGYQKAYEENLEADWANTGSAHNIHATSKLAHLNKESGENEAEYIFNEAVRENANLRRLDTQSRVNRQEASYSKTVNDNAYERLKANPTVDRPLGDLALRAQELTNSEKEQTDRLNTAQRVQNSNYAAGVISDNGIQDRAGDVEIDQYGALRVKAAAQAQQSSAYQERIKNYRNSFSYENIREEDALQLALGHNAAGYTASDELQEAAIQHVVDLKHVETIIRLQQGINLTTTAPQSVRQTFAGAMLNSSVKPKFIPASVLTDQIPQGLPDTPDNRGQALMEKWLENAVIKNKYDAEGLNTTDVDDINFLRRMVWQDPATGATSDMYSRLASSTDGAQALNQLRANIRTNFKDPQLLRKIGNRKDPLISLGRSLGMDEGDLRPDTP